MQQKLLINPFLEKAIKSKERKTYRNLNKSNYQPSTMCDEFTPKIESWPHEASYIPHIASTFGRILANQ